MKAINTTTDSNVVSMMLHSTISASEELQAIFKYLLSHGVINGNKIEALIAKANISTESVLAHGGFDMAIDAFIVDAILGSSETFLGWDAEDIAVFLLMAGMSAGVVQALPNGPSQIVKRGIKSFLGTLDDEEEFSGNVLMGLRALQAEVSVLYGCPLKGFFKSARAKVLDAVKEVK